MDDDAVFRQEFSLLLSDEGHEVASESSVARAVEALGRSEFDVVFSDLKMPRESGIDLLRAVRERWPTQIVIMVTGYASVSTAVEAMKLGAFDYIAKPFRADQVRRALELAADQLRYSGPRLEKGEPVEIAREIAARESIPVLLAGPPPAPPNLPSGVSYFEFDGREPARLRDAVESALRSGGRIGVVVAHAERALDGHRTDDISSWIGSLRDLVAGQGILAVGLDERGATRAQVEAIRAALSGPIVHDVLEALANPIRRAIVRRLKDGPTSFSTLMRAAELDDSPKMSFHVHRLLESGLIAHAGDEYRLTASGESASRVLREMHADLGTRAGPTVLFRPSRKPARP